MQRWTWGISLQPTIGVLCCLTASFISRADQFPICIDGRFDDWSNVPVAFADPAGDGGPSGIDFGRLWIADDERFLYVRIEVGQGIYLNESNALRVYLDTDADNQSGLPVAGIGAELEWRAGQRDGVFYDHGQSVSVTHSDIRFRAGPTVTATEFEMAFGLDTFPDGVHPLFQGPAVRVAILDAGGDQIPGASTTITYHLDAGTPPTPRTIPLERERPDDLRLITHNVEFDGPWTPGQEPRFGRQLAAVSPDILSFQEIYDHYLSETIDFVSRWVPLEPGESWDAVGRVDCKIISRYPIHDWWWLDGNIAALIDTTPTLGTRLLLINAHLPCCDNEVSRQAEIDNIMSFVRDARQPGGTVTLPTGTPIVITGDLNLVGLVQQQATLLTGDIVDEGTYGPDFAPDWDETDLADVAPAQTEKRMAYTWRDDTSSFWPGRLDYFIHTDSVLELGRHFTLYTPEMSAGNLNAYGLQSTDALASDHLLLCMDVRPPTVTRGDLDCDGDVDFDDINPFVIALGGQTGYQAAYPDCHWLHADCDADGDVDFDDINAFVALLGE